MKRDSLFALSFWSLKLFLNGSCFTLLAVFSFFLSHPEFCLALYPFCIPLLISLYIKYHGRVA
jgi:hypothetical protein